MLKYARNLKFLVQKYYMKLRNLMEQHSVQALLKFSSVKERIPGGEEDFPETSPVDDWEDEFARPGLTRVSVTFKGIPGEVKGTVMRNQRDLDPKVHSNTSPFGGMDVLFKACNETWLANSKESSGEYSFPYYSYML